MRKTRRSLPAFLLALAATAPLVAAPAGADPASTAPESIDVVMGIVDSSEAGFQVEYLMGGIGIDSREALKEREKDYPVRFLLADSEGHLVSQVHLTIRDAKKREVLKIEKCEPWLLVKLPAGRYVVEAQFLGTARTQNFSIEGTGPTRIVPVVFPVATGD